MAGLVAGCIELGLTIIPRGGGTGYTGGAIPLTLEERRHQHREARGDDRGGDDAAARRRRRGGDDLDRGRRRHAARRRCGRARRLCLRGRPDLGGGLVHRRQRRHERRRQEGGALGHRARQPGLLAHGHARCQVAGGHPHRPQPRQDPRRADGLVRAASTSTPSGKKLERTERLDDSRRGVPQGRPRQGRHRQVPRRPARHPEGRLRRPDHQRALGRAPHADARAHRLPRILRQRQGRGAGDRRDQGLHVRSAARAGEGRACCWPASSTSTTAI